MTYTVFIPTAGIGSRLNEETKYINKSLVTADHKPIISHQLSLFPNDTNFVVALGYKGRIVREFLQLAYPKIKIKFVNIEPYKGNGSGLGFTLLSCKKYLMRPFIFMSCDTLVTKKIPLPNKNWVFYSNVKNISQYRSLKIINGKVKNIYEKGKKDKDLKAYTGLAGIYNYHNFWDAMLSGEKDAIDQGEAYALKKILGNDNIDGIFSHWYDSGNKDSIKILRNKFISKNSPNILPKEEEAIWFVKNHAIKFSIDKTFIRQRFIRSKKLRNFVPKIISCTPNMYKYPLVEGEVLSKIITLPLFALLLKQSKIFWKIKKLNKNSKISFKKECLNFYKDKTITRVNMFYKKFKKRDRAEMINGRYSKKLKVLLSKINWSEIADGIPSRYHGDYHFENILWDKKSKSFTFLDWRQNFAGNLHHGDIYYDLAKLMHGLIVSHESVSNNKFKVIWNNDNIFYSIDRKKILLDCELHLKSWLTRNNYSLKKVNIICSLIFLNIAALHHYPYSLFLYSLGKDMLNRELN